jgi:hypothetical protein
MGVAIMADGPLAGVFWRVLNALDYSDGRRLGDEIFAERIDNAERHRRDERTSEAAFAADDHDDQEQYDVFQRISRCSARATSAWSTSLLESRRRRGAELAG